MPTYKSDRSGKRTQLHTHRQLDKKEGVQEVEEEKRHEEGREEK